MLRFANQEEMDAARAEWFAKFDERKAEREAKEEQRRKDEVFWREWWDKEKGTEQVGGWRERNEKGREVEGKR
jgi:COX assembly mitochondrial protein 1